MTQRETNPYRTERKTQRDLNPYKYTDSNKRYYTFDYYLRRRFGRRCAKIPLDAGFTCPNIDGRCGHGGCTYCLSGSGAAVGDTLEEQYRAGIAAVSGKWHDFATIPYLQAHTNTYAPTDVLRGVYSRAAALDGAVMLAIATRADCLGDDVVALLAEVSKTIPLFVELGLQTSSDETAKLINRGHTTADFEAGYRVLRNAGGNITVCVHLIDGLPGEDADTMRETARYVASLEPDAVKIHLLHVLRGTPLCRDFESGLYVPPEQDEYVSVVCDQLELLPPDTVIARLTGDGMPDSLVAPLWSRRKIAVINDIDKELFRRGSYQGIKYEK